MRETDHRSPNPPLSDKMLAHATMRFSSIATLIFAGLFSFGCGAPPSENAASESNEVPDARQPNEDASYIYVVVHYEDDIPRIDFEGDALVKENSRRYEKPEATDFTFTFIAFRPPREGFVAGSFNDDPKYHVIEFSGSMKRSGADGFRLRGTLLTKLPLTLRFLGMIREGSGDDNDFSEMLYPAGKHAVEFDGVITGWWRSESDANIGK